MKYPPIFVVIRDAAGHVLHSETKRAFNAGIRASEKAIGNLARSEGTYYQGEAPVRIGDRRDLHAPGLYTRRWVSPNGRVLFASIERLGG